MEYFINMYEEQFKRYLVVTQGFMRRLKKNQDKKICVHWIQRLLDLSPCSILVVSYRNQFLEYLMTVIQEAILEDILQDEPTYILQEFQQVPPRDMDMVEDPTWLDEELDIPPVTPKLAKPDAPYFAHMTDNQKTYVATKALPGKGVLVYLAVSTDPALGWSNMAE